MRFSRQEVMDYRAGRVERDAFYRRYGYNPDQSAAFVLSRALPLPGRILEIGTGKGRFLTALLAHVPRVTTVDIDPAEQRHARLQVAAERPSSRARFVIADAAGLPWPEHSFDSVVSMNALHHMRDLPRVIDEILRVAKSSGRIALADFNARGFAVADEMHRAEGRVHERVPYRFQDLIERFATDGWTAVLHAGECLDVLVAGSGVAPAGGGGATDDSTGG